jgi:transcriptional regulator with AAA-type ATPase domain
MPLFTSADRRFAQAISDLAHCNPFLPQRVELERVALGETKHAGMLGTVDIGQRVYTGQLEDLPQLLALVLRSEALLERTRAKVVRWDEWHAHEQELYEDLVLFVVYYRQSAGFDRVIAQNRERAAPVKVRMVDSLVAQASRYLVVADTVLPLYEQLAHIVAVFFQIRRAFRNIFNYIIGVSRPAARLRAAVWQSIFTHDLRRYRRALYDRMADYTTLVTGPSGTGKELVARAVGLSRYISFDAKTGRFAENFAESFFPLNLSAMSPTLIESELFGHRRGAFTGAVEERAGWLEVCPRQGTVFLDEIGELDPAIQVKLLRVLQDRTFSRLGETATRTFSGKLIAATNRDLATQMRTKEFREDLYYRLCSDIIVTPSLHERIADNRAELETLVAHMAARLVGSEGPDVTTETLQVIREQLGPRYAWPGNVRELEQCVRNVLIRKAYVPTKEAAPTRRTAHEALWASIEQGGLTADRLLQSYCTLVYAQTGSYEATAEKLAIDRRTVKAKVDTNLLAEFRR